MPLNFGSTPYSSETLPANTFPVSAVFVPGTASGNLTAMQGGPATTDGNGYTSAPAAIYVASGSNVVLGSTGDAANASTVLGQLKQIQANTASVVIGSGTVTANQGGSWTVTVNAGTNLNTSALALDTSINGVLVTQGSTTSGEKGPLVQGAVTTGSPSYTTTQTSPLSLTTAGALRVDASATTQPISAASLPLPSGAALDSTLQSILTDTADIETSVANIPPLGQALAAASVPVVLTAAQLTTLTPPAAITGFALDTSVNGILLAQGSTTSGEKGPMVQGAVTTNAPSYTTAQTSPLSLDASGLLRVSIKDTPSNTNNFNVNLAASAATVTVSGTVTANQGGAPWSDNITQIGGANIVTGGASGLIAVGGPVASGGSNADNPLKVGGAFNTTQPTVTNAQIVDAQYTARGAAIVSTGVDTFNVTVNAALPAGSATIGAVTQASGPWTSNVTQFGNNNVVTGTGAGGSGIPRVTVSNDSAVLATPQAGTTGGATTNHLVSASGTNATNVKASAGLLYGFSLTNTNAAARYVHFYNTSSAPTVGTTVPVATVGIPGNGVVIRAFPVGAVYGTGISFGTSTGAADNDSGSVGAGDLVVDLEYK